MNWLKSPALHMLVIGGLIFAFMVLSDGAVAEKKPRVVVPGHRVDLLIRDFMADYGRLPTLEQRDEMINALIDEEVLYQYALSLGMHENSAAQRRLAQIAEFVEANPHEAQSEAESAAAAMELGLHHGDLVVRRILTDSARRLIRAVVLLRKPSSESLDAFYSANAQEFSRPARIRIAHLTLNSFKSPDTEVRAQLLLQRIRDQELGLEAALALSDESLVPPHLPWLTEQALATRFGTDFATEVMALSVGGWSAPIASRYGHHLVQVHERLEASLPALDEIRDRVEERLLQKLADEWLELRLQELRLDFEIITPTLLGQPS